jgi:hypothetical protein
VGGRLLSSEAFGSACVLENATLRGTNTPWSSPRFVGSADWKKALHMSVLKESLREERTREEKSLGFFAWTLTLY